MDGEHTVGREPESPSDPGSPPTPWFIISLIILSWAVFLYSLYKNNCPSVREDCILQGTLGRLSFQPLSLNPQLGPAGSTLVDLGALDWSFKKRQTKKWHILSSIFFHTGLVDLVFDTISLLFMGIKLENIFGTVKIGSLFLLSSLGGSLWAFLKLHKSVYVGGSSGVCGLTGGAFAEFFINSNLHEAKFKTFLSLCLGVAINFSVTLYRWVDVTGNLGGLYFGFLLGFLLLIRHQPGSAGYEYKGSDFDRQQLILNYSQYQRVLWVIALISTIMQFLYSSIKYILL